MILDPNLNLNLSQRKWLEELATLHQVKDLGVYIRSLKRLNDFALIKPHLSLNQHFIDDFLNTYLFNLVITNELRLNTARTYYNICFRFITWFVSDSEIVKRDFKQIFSNVVVEELNQELTYSVLLSETHSINKCSIEFKLMLLITLREKHLGIEDVVSLSIDHLGLIKNTLLNSALKNYIVSNRRSSRLEKVRDEVPKNKIFYSQRGEIFSLDSFRSRLSDLNKTLNNNVRITSKAIRNFSITDDEVRVLISGIIND
ncbi:TPA: hypothetical protein I7145_13340 [Vibrio vulnificus]|nr:hypothetical protein [Vibrio vulnificus]